MTTEQNDSLNTETRSLEGNVLNALPDEQARVAALDPTGSFIVQAPAGSGKTTLLTKRYIELLKRVDKPERIVAITFTRKAAHEMRERIVDALKNENNAIHPSRLRIQTIDSLCYTLVQRAPLLTTLGYAPEISERAWSLYEDAAEALLNDLESDTPSHTPPWQAALQNLLLHLDNHFSRTKNLLAAMLAQRDQWLPFIMDEHDRERLEASLRRVVQTSLHDVAIHFDQQTTDASHENTTPISPAVGTHAPLENPQGRNPATSHGVWLRNRLFSLIQSAIEHLDNDHPLTLWRDLQAWPTPDVQYLKHWQALVSLLLTSSGAWRKSVSQRQGFPAPSGTKDPVLKEEYARNKTAMLNIINGLQNKNALHQALITLHAMPHPEYSDNQWAIVSTLTTLLPVLVAHLKLVFRENNTVDFTEVQLAAKHALGSSDNPSELGLMLDYEIQHLLVDEFQDTSIAQFELLKQLTTGWTPGDGRTMFLVGDPMQSIYRFRQADVGLFLLAKHHGIGNITLESLTLTSNFRSDKKLVDWFNTHLSPIFPENEHIAHGAVPYSKSMGLQTYNENDYIDVCTHTFYNGGNPDEGATEPQRIVGIIQETKTQYPNDSIAILVRSRTHLIELIPCLHEANVTFNAVDIEKLIHHPLALDLYALTQALMHPANRLAWLSVLRAPWCRLTLRDLYEIAQQDNIVKALISCDDLSISEEAKDTLHTITPILIRASKERSRLPLSSWIKTTWHAIDGPAYLNDENEIRYAQQYFDVLERFDHSNGSVDHDILYEALEQERINTLSTDKNALHVMTIHKAKGLEFDTVIIPRCNKTLARNDHQLLLWRLSMNEQDEKDLMLAPIRAATDTKDDIYNAIQHLENIKQKNETIRLLYVALTRARKNIHLLTTFDDDDVSLKKGSFAELLQELFD